MNKTLRHIFIYHKQKNISKKRIGGEVPLRVFLVLTILAHGGSQRVTESATTSQDGGKNRLNESPWQSWKGFGDSFGDKMANKSAKVSQDGNEKQPR